jgi:hypothetical protein
MATKEMQIMVIGFLCPISVEGVIRDLRWGIGPKGTEAFSSHHIWMFIPSVGQHRGGVYGRTYICMNGCKDDRMNIHLQLAAIFKRFELGGWDWAHFLCLFKLCSDLTNFLKIHLIRIAQMIE